VVSNVISGVSKEVGEGDEVFDSGLGVEIAVFGTIDTSGAKDCSTGAEVQEARAMINNIELATVMSFTDNFMTALLLFENIDDRFLL
jgi:hypothetical protein